MEAAAEIITIAIIWFLVGYCVGLRAGNRKLENLEQEIDRWIGRV